MSCAFLAGEKGTPGRTGACQGGRRVWRTARTLDLLACIVALPQLAQAKKPYGKVLDEQAFESVRAYCFDTAELSDQDAYLGRGFAKQEDKPKHLLAKLPWKLLPSCQEGNPDAVVKVHFELIAVYGMLFGADTPTPMTRSESTRDESKAVLEVVENNSDQIIYKAEATPLANTSSNSSMPAPDNPTALRLRALRNVVSTSAHDVRLVTTHGK